MLGLQIRYTDDEVLDGLLENHFKGNLLVIIDNVLIKLTGKTGQELEKEPDPTVGNSLEELIPNMSYAAAACETIISARKKIGSNTQEELNILEEYMIARAISYYGYLCGDEEGLGIPFPMEDELRGAYEIALSEEFPEWDEAEVCESVDEEVEQILNTGKWPEILFDDMDYELLDQYTMEYLKENRSDLGIRFPYEAK